MDIEKIREIVGFTAALKLINADTGSVVAEFTAGQMLALQEQIEAGTEYGNPDLSAIAGVIADNCMGEYNLRVEAGNSATAIAFAGRSKNTYAMAAKLGTVKDADVVTFAVDSDVDPDADLPDLNLAEMALLLHETMPMVESIRQAVAYAAQAEAAAATKH